MQAILDRYKAGISISKVTMQQAQPPEQVQAAFDDAVKANQDRERQKNEGQAYANDVVPKARGTAARLTQESEGYRQRVIANAEGEASRFRQIMTEYNRAPAVTRQRLYLEAMQQVYTNTTKILVDQKAGSNLLFLPLDKILQMSAAGARRLAGHGQRRGGGVPSRPRRRRRRIRARARHSATANGRHAHDPRRGSDPDRAGGRAGGVEPEPVHRRPAPECHRVPARRAGAT